MIEERSSGEAFRFSSNLESTLAEEGVPRLRYLDDLCADKNPGSSAAIETEPAHEREEDASESRGSAAAQEGGGRVGVEEDKVADGPRGLDFDPSACGPTKREEMLTSHGEGDAAFGPGHPSGAAGDGSAVHPGEASKPRGKEIARAQPHCRRSALERKMPMRSSLRACKRVLATKLLAVDEEKKVRRKHFCLYCKMAFTQLEKHLEKRHAGETDVVHAIHFPKGSKVRQTLMDQIRSKGNYEHNCEVVKGGARSPVASARDLLPCQHCFALHRRADLWRHEQSCKVGKGEEVVPVPEPLTEGCREIISVMHQDHISNQIRSDPLICKYGNSLSVKYDRDKTQFAYIAQKMRELGRFVLAVNELDSSVRYLHQICVPSRFELAVEGAKRIGGFDPESSQFKTASLVSKIGYSLKRAAEIAFGESRAAGDGEAESELKKFIHLLNTRWSSCFSRKALALSAKREVTPAELDRSTVTEDLIKLHRFISGEEEEAARGLRAGPSLSTWKKLSEATLADICLFNRGRVGNIGRMLLQTYTHRKLKGAFVPSADQVKKNSKLELDLGAQLTRLEMEGQYGRNTLVLLTESMVSSVDLLVEHRERAGVSRTNPYLFARTEGPSFIRGLDCFRRAAMECGVKNPEALLSSCLREQIACYWQLMSLGEQESKRVASLLGIPPEDCCRLWERAPQLEEVSRQLLGLDRTPAASPPTTARDGNLHFALRPSAVDALVFLTPFAPPPRSQSEVRPEEEALGREGAGRRPPLLMRLHRQHEGPGEEGVQRLHRRRARPERAVVDGRQELRPQHAADHEEAEQPAVRRGEPPWVPDPAPEEVPGGRRPVQHDHGAPRPPGRGRRLPDPDGGGVVRELPLGTEPHLRVPLLHRRRRHRPLRPAAHLVLHGTERHRHAGGPDLLAPQHHQRTHVGGVLVGEQHHHVHVPLPPQHHASPPVRPPGPHELAHHPQLQHFHRPEHFGDVRLHDAERPRLPDTPRLLLRPQEPPHRVLLHAPEPSRRVHV